MRTSTEILEFEDVFANVIALYGVLKNQNRPRALHRAELRAGEVTAEALDFICDVEIKARNYFAPNRWAYNRFMLEAAKEEPRFDCIPETRQGLGEVFMLSNLNYDGDYRVLYFRAKNNQLVDHEQGGQFPEEG